MMHLYRRMGRPMLPVDALALHLLRLGQTRPPDPRSIQRLLRALDAPDYAYGSLIPMQVTAECFPSLDVIAHLRPPGRE